MEKNISALLTENYKEILRVLITECQRNSRVFIEKCKRLCFTFNPVYLYYLSYKIVDKLQQYFATILETHYCAPPVEYLRVCLEQISDIFNFGVLTSETLLSSGYGVIT